MATKAYPPINAPLDDPELAEAAKRARATFKYFWRECFAERHRIIPGLSVQTVKFPFPHSHTRGEGSLNTEHMWVSDIDFDGRDVRGTLINESPHVREFKQGQSVIFPVGTLTDWMYAQQSRAYGAFSVQVLRARMDTTERKRHDDAWGLDFGDTACPLIVPWENLDDEHALFQNMLPGLVDALAANPSMATAADDEGWTMLHRHSLAGSAGIVEALLNHGADATASTPDGRTAADLAHAAGWPRVAALLAAHA